ncbi:MAG: hypothetical protein ACR2JH_08705, partial [Solirubrobacteraceae bacterium]
RVRVATLCANPANELHGEESSSQHAVPPNRDGHFTPNSTGEPKNPPKPQCCVSIDRQLERG